MDSYIYFAVGAREATMSISAAVDRAPVLTMRCCFGHSGPTITPRPHSQHTQTCTHWSVSRIQCPSCKDAKTRSSLHGYELTRMRREEQTESVAESFHLKNLKRFSINENTYRKNWTKCALNCNVHVVHLNKMLSISLKAVYDIIKFSVYLKWEITLSEIMI